MSKIDVTNIDSLTNEQSFITRTNANYAEIETKSDSFLSRDGTSPNQMAADLDMNTHRILNLPAAVSAGEPVRFAEFQLGTPGPAGPPGAAGTPGAAGAAGTNGTNGTNGADGASPGFVQVYSTTTADADPGNGTFRFNNATITSATTAYLDNLDASGNTVSTFMDTWDDSTNSTKGVLQFVKVGAPGTWAVFKVTGSVVNGTGYRKVTLSSPSTGGTFTNGNSFSITFFPAGDKGTDGLGAGDVVGPASSTDNAVVRFDSTTGKLIQDSVVTIADTTGLIAGARFANAGLGIEDTNASHLLVLTPGSDLTANRVLTLTTGDAARTLTLGGNATLNGGTVTSGTHSGTNTGDQTITLTGDVTGTGTGSFAATIANDAVTYAKMQNISATDKLLGRSTAGAGDTEEITCTAAGRALIDDVDATAQRATLGLTIGTNVQAQDATLASIAGLGTAADKMLYTTGVDTWAELAVTSVGRGLLDDTTASAQRTTLGLAIGTDVQAFDAQLFSNIPQNSQSAAYTLVLTDGEKHIFHPSADTTARIWTIPANSTVAYPVGTAITFVNQNSAGAITIAITTDTMRLAGAGTTGSRTLAANGIATALKVTTTEWIISGTGLT